jgi:hypothetical protein
MPTGIIHSKVRGVTFENRQDIIRKAVRPGMRLTAIREPNNPHGGNAIGLWAGQQQIGHLSSDLAEELAPWMDAGKPLTVTVTDMTGNGPGESIGVNIVIDKQGEKGVPAATQNPRAARPMNKALIVLLLLATVIVCGVAQSPVVAVVCVAAAAWLLWQWRRAGGKLL